MSVSLLECSPEKLVDLGGSKRGADSDGHENAGMVRARQKKR